MTLKAVRALDRRLGLLPIGYVHRPPKGWIRAVRDALGMTTRQLAARLGLAQSRVVALEQGEVEETLTLASLRRAAEALNCRLVYAFLPNEPLEGILRKQAEQWAQAHLQPVGHSMRLENQALSDDDERLQREALVDELLRGSLRRLWDQPA